MCSSALMKEFCDPTSAFDKSGAFSLLIEFPKVAHFRSFNSVHELSR